MHRPTPLSELAALLAPHALALLDWKDVGRAQNLARRTGGKIIKHGPARPLSKPNAPAPKRKQVALQKRTFASDYRAKRFAQTPGFITWNDVTRLVDCRSWPPKQTVVGEGVLAVTVRERDGATIVSRPGTLRVGKVELVDRLPDGFEPADAIWVGELAVLLPSGPTVRAGASRRPLVWNGKNLAPAKGVPDATATMGPAFPPFLKQGFARTGNGTDVLIWEGAGWVAKGDRFVEVMKLAPDLRPGEWIIGAPAPGDGFFYPHAKKRIATIRHAQNGSCSERARFEGVISGPLRTAPDGRVIFALNRYAKPKTPVLGVFDPRTNALSFIGPQPLGFRKDDQADAYGVSADGKLWVVDNRELRRVPFQGSHE